MAGRENIKPQKPTLLRSPLRKTPEKIPEKRPSGHPDWNDPERRNEYTNSRDGRSRSTSRERSYESREERLGLERLDRGFVSGSPPPCPPSDQRDTYFMKVDHRPRSDGLTSYDRLGFGQQLERIDPANHDEIHQWSHPLVHRHAGLGIPRRLGSGPDPEERPIWDCRPLVPARRRSQGGSPCDSKRRWTPESKESCCAPCGASASGSKHSSKRTSPFPANRAPCSSENRLRTTVGSPNPYENMDPAGLYSPSQWDSQYVKAQPSQLPPPTCQPFNSRPPPPPPHPWSSLRSQYYDDAYSPALGRSRRTPPRQRPPRQHPLPQYGGDLYSPTDPISYQNEHLGGQYSPCPEPSPECGSSRNPSDSPGSRRRGNPRSYYSQPHL